MVEIKKFLKRNENGFLFADLLFIASVFYIIKTKNHYITPFALIIIAIFIYITIFHHGTKVINNSGKPIDAKDEDSDTVYTVRPGEFRDHIDGIKVDGKVYKLPDGVRATVTKNRKIMVYSLLGYFFYLTAGGELTKAPDDGWNKLFPVQEQED